MAVLLIEGFDHMNAGLITAKGWTQNGNSMVAGRFGGQAVRYGPSTGLNVTAIKTLSVSASTIIVGFALRPGTLNTAAVETEFLEIRAGATTVASVWLVTSPIQFRVKNAAGTTVATGPTSIVLNTWHYYEVKIVIAGASGSCEVWLDGASEIAPTTGNFGSTNADTIVLRTANSGTITGAVVDYDDVYVVDTTGAAPRNTFLGDVRVETLYPSADGAHTAFTPNSGTAHFSRVNEKTATFPDGDTSYVSDGTVGDIDTYAVDDLSISSGTVFAVQSAIYARKDDAGVRQLSDVVRQAGADTVGATVMTMQSQYAFFTQLRNQDPTGADWTISNVNADEFGVKVIA